MSFASMPLFTGDYLRDTRHLSPLRHGVYLLALMHCWDSKGPMPLDEQESAGICNCRSSDEIEALRYIIDRYFTRMDDGHYNKRVAEEVAKAERWGQKSRDGGLHSAEVRRAKARRGAALKAIEPPFNHPSTTLPRVVQGPLVSPSPSPSPSFEVKTHTVRKRAAPAVLVSVDDLISEGVDRQHATDWLVNRKTKGLAPLTPSIWAATKDEATKAGLTVQAAIQEAAGAGWGGFKASWLVDGRARKADAFAGAI